MEGEVKSLLCSTGLLHHLEWQKSASRQVERCTASNSSFLGSSSTLVSPVVLIALVPISRKDEDDPADTTCEAKPHSLIVTAAVLEIRAWAHMSCLGLD